MEVNRRDVLALLGIGGVALLTGCGGGGRTTEDSRVFPTIAIQWRSAPTRLEATSLARSVRISLTSAADETATLLAVRPDPVPAEAVEHRFAQAFLPGEFRFEAHFYINADGTGDIVASASGTLDLLPQGNVALGPLSISDDIEWLSIAEVPSQMAVGASFTPRIQTVVAGSPNASGNITAFPANSVRWTFDETMLRRNGDSFTALRAGRFYIQSEFTRRNGEPVTGIAGASVQSAPVPGQTYFENFLPLLAQPIYQNLLVGMTTDYSAAVLLNPASGERTQFALPAGGRYAFLDANSDLLWSVGSDARSVWKTHLQTGTSELSFQLPYARQWELFPLGGAEEFMLAKPTDESSFLYLVQGKVVGSPFKNTPRSPLVGDGTFAFDVNDYLEHYRPGVEGPVLLSRAPRQFDLFASFRQTPTLLFVGDKTVREPGTQRILRTLDIPANCSGLPRSFSSSGRLVIYQGYTDGSSEGLRALQMVAYDTASGRQVLDQRYFDAEQCFFIDDHTLAYTERGGVTIQPGLF